MSTESYELAGRKGNGPWIAFATVMALLLVAALSFTIVILVHEPGLTIPEALAGGFGGVGGLVIGLIAAVLSLIAGLIATVFGLAVGGGALALTLFLLASPVIALVLIWILMRRRSVECPDPSRHL